MLSDSEDQLSLPLSIYSKVKDNLLIKNCDYYKFFSKKMILSKLNNSNIWFKLINTLFIVFYQINN